MEKAVKCFESNPDLMQSVSFTTVWNAVGIFMKCLNSRMS